MTKGRLEAFSDGVIAILITIMVLELKIRDGGDWHALERWCPSLPDLRPQLRVSRHLLEQPPSLAARGGTGERAGAVGQLHLLFWLSLVPFATHWMGRNHNAPVPTATYGAIMLMCGVAFLIEAKALIALHGPASPLAIAFGKDWKGKISVLLYSIAIPAAFVHQVISNTMSVAVAVLW